MKTSQEIFDHLMNSTIMVCERSNGMIAPSTIKIGKFHEVIGEVSFYSGRGLYFYDVGIYLFENGKMINIHRKIHKLFLDGFLIPQEVKENLYYPRHRLIVANKE
jgi:hypothetical protein